MQPLSDLSSVTRTLRDGISKGYWTLEDLDIKPKGCLTPQEKFRNLLRDRAPVAEQIEVVNPKDFAAVLPPRNTPTQPEGLPLTLDDDNPF